MSTQQTYRKKPVEVVQVMHFKEGMSSPEAMEIYFWIERNTEGSFEPYTEEIPKSGVSIDPDTGQMMIATLEGIMRVSPGDYVIRGVAGEFYSCKPDIFEATYEAV